MNNIVRLGPEYFPKSSIGRPVSNGSIYIGDADTDPEIVGNQKSAYALQENGSVVELSQPISISLGGVPEYNGSPVTLLVSGNYSLKVLNAQDSQVYYVPHTIFESPAQNIELLSNYDDLASAVTAIGSSPVELWIDKNDSTNTTTPSNIFLKFIPGYTLSGIVEIYSSANIIAANGQHIFDNSSTITYTTIGILYAGWYDVRPENAHALNTTNEAVMITSAKANGCTVQFDEGTYNFTLYLSVRQGGVPVSIEDFNGLTVQGVGENTIIRTTNPVDGSDVFQFNGVENVTVRDLSVASVLPGGAINGSNGFSFANGAKNITIENCRTRVMPYVSNGSIDGGSAYSIQHTGTLDFGDITIRNCVADGGAFGLHYVGSGAGATSSNPAYNIKFENNKIKNHYSGIYVETSFAAGAIIPLESQAFNIIGNQIIDCQRSAMVLGCTNVSMLGNTLYNSLTSAVDPATSSAWLSGDTVLRGLYLGSIHHSNISNNPVYNASVQNFIFLKCAAQAGNNTPIDRLILTNNNCFGVASGDGIKSDYTGASGYITNSFIANNTIEGAAGAAYDINLFDSVHTDTIVVGPDYQNKIRAINSSSTDTYRQLELVETESGSANNRVGIVGQHYDPDEEKVGLMAAALQVAANRLLIGGGHGLVNAATSIEHYTAADNTTTEGDKVVEIDHDSTAGNTRLLLWDVDNGQLERVSVGAADSGGAGFKSLRIPN